MYNCIFMLSQDRNIYSSLYLYLCSSPYNISQVYDARLGRVTLAIKRFCLVVKIKDKSVQSVLVGGKCWKRPVS